MQIDVRDIADKADMIINGYAFTNNNGQIRVLNLNSPGHATVIYEEKIIETNMDDIENEIVMEYYENNKKYMED